MHVSNQKCSYIYSIRSSGFFERSTGLSFLRFIGKFSLCPPGAGTFCVNYTGPFMERKALVRSRQPVPLAGKNSMTFPQELRAAIPEERGYSGRVLELDAIDGKVRAIGLSGPVVHLDLRLQETGKLTGKFTLSMDLQPS